MKSARIRARIWFWTPATIVLIALVASWGEVRAAAIGEPSRIQGRVVALRSGNVVVVRHLAGRGMPAMTMTFQVRPSTWARLRPGLSLEAGVDTRTDPWTLEAVHTVAFRVRATAPYIAPLREGDALPNFSFIDQRGYPVTMRQFGGSVLVFSFIYTRCPDPRMCPLVSAKFQRLQRESARERIHLLEVTLDPSYDTPAILARYAARFAANPRRWTIATGDPVEVAYLGSRVGIASTPAADGTSHSEAVVVVDPSGRIARIVDGNEWTVEQILLEARAALGAKPSAFARVTFWLAAGVAAACGGTRSGFSTGAAIALFVVLLSVAALLVQRIFRSLFV